MLFPSVPACFAANGPTPLVPPEYEASYSSSFLISLPIGLESSIETVAVAPEPPPPEKVTVGSVPSIAYPNPGSVIVIAVTASDVIVAVAVAARPPFAGVTPVGSEIVTVGAEV